MTFGKNNGSRSLRLPATLLVWLLLPDLVQISVAQTSLPSEHEAGANGWSVERLIERLAMNPESEVRFEETIFSDLLARPMKTQGTLRFIPPAGLEKHITAPPEERHLIDGDTIHYETKSTKSKGKNGTLSLQDYPALRAFIEAFRSTLTNDVATLRRFYSMTLHGEPSGWVLILHPLDTSVQALAETIRFSGEREHIHRIEILAPGGDRSVMVFTTSLP
jgi:Outer membrane lipoprotein carrier protein LolA-like